MITFLTNIIDNINKTNFNIKLLDKSMYDDEL